jgi:hypothetical protein
MSLSRWTSQFEEVLYVQKYFTLLQRFFESLRNTNDSDSLGHMLLHLQTNAQVSAIILPGHCSHSASLLQAVRLQAEFATTHLAKLNSNICILQLAEGGILDVMGMFDVMTSETPLGDCKAGTGELWFFPNPQVSLC